MFNKSKQTRSDAANPRPAAAPVPRVQQPPAPRPAATAEADTSHLPSSGMPSIISTALHVTGNLNCAGDIEINGTIDGDVKARDVRIGVSGKVKGKVTAESVYVDGMVRGQIVARNVALAGSAYVHGDVDYEMLSIAAGAFFDGNCRPLSEKDRVQAQPEAQAQPQSQNGSLASAKPMAGAPAA